MIPNQCCHNFKNGLNIHSFIVVSDLEQGSQTRDPWAHMARQMRLCGPRAYQKLSKFLLNLVQFESFLSYLCPADATLH